MTRVRLHELRGAREAQGSALGLTEDPAVRRFLTAKLLALYDGD